VIDGNQERARRRYFLLINDTDVAIKPVESDTSNPSKHTVDHLRPVPAAGLTKVSGTPLSIHRASIIPIAFWYFSLGGSLILLLYAIHRRDPVFMTGQALGMFVYIRNLLLIRRERRGIAP